MNKNTGYVIRDNNGFFPVRLGLSVKEDGKEVCWDYTAIRNADRWHCDKNQAEAQIQKLHELNEIAGIKELTWELVYANPEDFPRVQNAGVFMIEQDIPRGWITKHRKGFAEISRTYKAIFNEIEMQRREKTNGGGAPIN